MKYHSLGSKIAAIVSTIIILTIVILLSYTSYVNRNNAVLASENQIGLQTKNFALKIESFINSAFDVLETETASLLMLHEQNNLDKQTALNLIELNLRKDENYTGMCLVFEANTLCADDLSYPELMDNGYFIPYLYYTTDKSIEEEALVDYDVPELGDYYLIPKETNKQLLTEPYIYAINGVDILLLTLVDPIMDNEEFLGITTIDYDIRFIEQLAATIKKENYDGKINISVISTEGFLLANTADTLLMGQNIKALYKDDYAERLKSITLGKKETKYLNDSLVINIPIKFENTDNYWQIQVKIPKEVIYSSANTQTLLFIIYGAVILIISIFIIYFMVNRFIAPIKELTEISKQLAKGNLDVEIKISGNDEIGVLSEAFKSMATNFQNVIINIQNSSNAVLGAGDQLASISVELAQNANKQVSTTENLSISMAQILSRLNLNSQKAEITGKVSNKSANEMKESNEIFVQTLDSVSQISKKISIITEIAGKTDILSINAAIEAARAGEVGKGFAVVAQEIRKLADKTKLASSEINTLSKKGQDISKLAGEKLEKTIPEVIKSAKLVSSIVSANRDQQQEIEQINTSIQQFTEITVGNSSSAEEMAVSAEELLAQAEQLKSLISIFKTEKTKNADNH